MLNVTAQRGDVLHLLRRVPQQQRAVAVRLLWLRQPSPHRPQLQPQPQRYWMKATGFGTDTPVIVTVEHGQLLMRIVAE
ncbi:hypothetical protein NAL19_442 [Pectobacterium sp. F1-1]|uniref:type I toxin-antitoxin system SymE family toxin n=1 Tax=Pectobacterium sp. F1-1 TaxID=2949614 RepID=UPI0021D7C3AB|nr:type I toxin-antitoxin system SymE family toxin [Pectobacterium sp. F1-1]UYA58701.1 hypothetical protein NAL19_442 [Pectobacterium sp. F1-1]